MDTARIAQYSRRQPNMHLSWVCGNTHAHGLRAKHTRVCSSRSTGVSPCYPHEQIMRLPMVSAVAFPTIERRAKGPGRTPSAAASS